MFVSLLGFVRDPKTRKKEQMQNKAKQSKSESISIDQIYRRGLYKNPAAIEISIILFISKISESFEGHYEGRYEESTKVVMSHYENHCETIMKPL